MEKYIGILESVNIINRTFGCNIDPRGGLRLYEQICKDLGLNRSVIKNTFTEKQLLDAIYNYKLSELQKTVYETR